MILPECYITQRIKRAYSITFIYFKLCSLMRFITYPSGRECLLKGKLTNTDGAYLLDHIRMFWPFVISDLLQLESDKITSSCYTIGLAFNNLNFITRFPYLDCR